MGMTAVLSEVELNQTLDSESYTEPPDGGPTVGGVFISINKALPAIPSRCGDLLRLRVTLTGVDGGYLDELGPGEPTIP